MEIKKQQKKQAKKVKGFAIDESLYSDFRDECKIWNLSMSEIIGEFIRRVTRLLKSDEGGEVVFGIEGDNWKQPEKIIYDGKEVIDRDGVRTIKKEEKKE